MSYLFCVHCQRNGDHAPLEGVLLSATSPNGNWQGLTDCAGNFIPTLAPGAYDVTFTKAGYVTATRQWLLGSAPDAPILVGMDASVAPFPPGTSRAPLPPFDVPGPDGNQVHTTLPANTVGLWTPKVARIGTKRANSWAVTIPNLPFVRGGSSRHPERCLTWFLDRWSPSWQATVLQTYAQRGYTHFRLSAPDSLYDNGQTLAQFVATAEQVKAAGFFVEVMLGSKNFDPANQTLAQYQARVGPVLDALIVAKAVDIVVPGWEWNLWNLPGDQATYPIIAWLASKCQAAGLWQALHFATYVTQWGNNGQNEDDFWNVVGHGQVQALNYQANPSDDAGLMQAHLNDVQRCFGRTGTSAVLWGDEILAALQFDQDQPDEDHGDLRGYELCCTPGNVPIAGFGNGARWPDGSVL